MHSRVVQSIADVDPDKWNALLNSTNPFLRHEFLLALEDTGCIGGDTGWQPQYLLLDNDAGEMAGAMPLYVKNNSYGEFVFDFSWANAYHQAGLHYYPKLTSAVPFSPVTGARLLADDDGPDAESIRNCLAQSAIELASRAGVSSMHVLFPGEPDLNLLKASGFLARKDCQFHWQNQDYSTFDEFLGQFTAAKRKKARRERRRVYEAGVRYITRHGGDLTAADWDEILPLYAGTFLRRGNAPYLNGEFFKLISQSMPDSLVVFSGYRDTELVAVAICLRSDTHLYGRYWGASCFIDSLHFETCYYQGIDYCIANKLQTFEPGTQGEHKISRGFVPTETWSAHWLSRPEFASAIDDYLARERKHIDHYMDVVNDHVPYRADPR